jgi:sodium/potassium-transporting ATPase subunit alpha
LPVLKKIPLWVLYLKELFSWFAILLWIGGILCVVGYELQPSQGLSNVYLAIVLAVVVIITATLSFYQNFKSDSLMESFKKMIPRDCLVIRGGKEKKIEGKKIVPGDIVNIKTGANIPADIRIIQSRDMKVDNSALTGEAEPLIRKKECTK